jgi:hypothetical protein
VPAVCEGAICGNDTSAEIPAKRSAKRSHKHLTLTARRPLNLVNLGRPIAALMKSKRYRPKKIRHADDSVTIERCSCAP